MRLQHIVVQVLIVAAALGAYHFVLRTGGSRGASEALLRGSKEPEALQRETADLAGVKLLIDDLARRVQSLEQKPSRGDSTSREALSDDYVTRTELEELLASFSGDGSLELLTDPHRVHEALAEYERNLRNYWKERPAQVSAEIAVETDQKMDEILDLIDETARAAGNDPEELRKSLGDRLANLHFKHSGQVTIVDRDGDFVYHAQGLTGTSLNHRNVNGDYAYQDVLLSNADNGRLSYYDFVQEDKARDVYLNYKKLPGLDWYVLVEGHEWKTME